MAYPCGHGVPEKAPAFWGEEEQHSAVSGDLCKKAKSSQTSGVCDDDGARDGTFARPIDYEISAAFMTVFGASFCLYGKLTLPDSG